LNDGSVEDRQEKKRPVARKEEVQKLQDPEEKKSKRDPCVESAQSAPYREERSPGGKVFVGKLNKSPRKSTPHKGVQNEI